MNSEKFVNWLQGYIDASGEFSREVIKKKLAQVSNNSYGWPPPHWYRPYQWPYFLNNPGIYCATNSSVDGVSKNGPKVGGYSENPHNLNTAKYRNSNSDAAQQLFESMNVVK